MNVAIVVLDTLRSDAFERHFDWLPGKRFDNAWSPSHWTVPVHGAMFTGLYPSETGVHAKNVVLNSNEQVLAERLSAAGYTTRAFSCNPYISPVFEFDRGFKEFTGSWRLRQLDPNLFDWGNFISETHGEGPTRYAKALYRCLSEDCDTLASLGHGVKMKLRDWDFVGNIDDDGATEALRYLQDTDFGSQEFLYLNLMEAHTPYDPPKEYRTVDVAHGQGLEATISDEHSIETDPELISQAYGDCVRYLSDIYEDIFSTLANQFDYVITVSDHGELLGEHGGWMHGYGLYPELTHVPLSIYGPGMDDERTDDLVSLLDIHATVLDLAISGNSPRGRSLATTDRQNRCLTEYHGFTAQKISKLQSAGVDKDLISKFDQTFRGIAQSDHYGFETFDGFRESNGRSVTDKQAELQDLVADLNIHDSQKASEQEFSADVISQLEDLGYA